MTKIQSSVLAFVASLGRYAYANHGVHFLDCSNNNADAEASSIVVSAASTTKFRQKCLLRMRLRLVVLRQRQQLQLLSFRQQHLLPGRYNVLGRPSYRSGKYDIRGRLRIHHWGHAQLVHRIRHYYHADVLEDWVCHYWQS